MDLIVAADRLWGIGKDGSQPFFIREDLRRFRALTLGGCVVMGRKTLAALPGGPALWLLLRTGGLWLVAAYLVVTALAVLVCWRCGCLRRGMAKGIVTFGLFMASWLPLQVACLFHRTTSWQEIAHGRRPVPVRKAV